MTRVTLPDNLYAPRVQQTWPRTEEEAVARQEALRSRVIVAPGPESPAAVAGLDVAYDGDRLAAAVVVLDHRMDLDGACDLTLRLAPRFRLPETTRAADRACRDRIT